MDVNLICVIMCMHTMYVTRSILYYVVNVVQKETQRKSKPAELVTITIHVCPREKK